MSIDTLVQKAEKELKDIFARIEKNEETNTRKVLDAFRKFDVAQRHFSPTNGYGYDDIGRDTLEKIYAEIFHTEGAIVRPQIVSGTHALSLALFGLLLPGDHLLSATGRPYDTMQTVIGLTGSGVGSLMEAGIKYDEVPLSGSGSVDQDAVLAAIRPETKVVMFQRSRGYDWRKSLLPRDLEGVFRAIHSLRQDICILVDNCYGGFVTDTEPTYIGADLCVGSLIKNMGGGLAPTGGYIVGKEKAIERIAARLTAPGIGREEGSYAASYRPYYQGLFMAPHTVAEALKTAVLSAKLFEDMGLETSPRYDEERSDIIQAIKLETPERLAAFCRAIQAASPVDANCVPEAWDMPGYEDQVIMAAGTFVSGASIELSADGPMRPPYIAYQQGGLTYAHGKIAVTEALKSIFQCDDPS